MSTTSPLAGLPSDAKNHVLSFLPLPECLKYCRVSKQSLVEILPNLSRRRTSQLCERMAYQLSDPFCLISTFSPAFLQSAEAELQHSSANLLQTVTRKDQYFVLPSIAERIQGLYRAIPLRHPSNTLIRELYLDLEQVQLLGVGEEEMNTQNVSRNVNRLSSITNAHRLHNTILKCSTTHCDPITNADPPQHELTVRLDTYLGDVLISYYLMGHSEAGMVEGVTTQKAWLKQLSREKMAENPYDTLRWYQYYVFLHSTLLRTMPMTTDQLEQYKLTPICGIKGITVPYHTNYVQPHYPFLGKAHLALEIRDTSVIPVVFDNHDFFHTTTFREFGPLGPAFQFRGRDSIRTVKMGRQNLVAPLVSPQYMTLPAWKVEEEGRHAIESLSIQNWFTPEPPPGHLWAWLSELPRECYKNRPMTVESPTVTINFQENLRIPFLVMPPFEAPIP